MNSLSARRARQRGGAIQLYEFRLTSQPASSRGRLFRALGAGRALSCESARPGACLRSLDVSGASLTFPVQAPSLPLGLRRIAGLARSLDAPFLGLDFRV